MKPLVFLTFLFVAACDSGPRIVVRASLDGAPVVDLPVTAFPYDREHLQDSLRREAGDDAPTVPQELTQELHALDEELDEAMARARVDSTAAPRADSLRAARVRLATRVDSARARVGRWEARLIVRADSLGLRASEQAERSASADTTDGAGRAVLPASAGQSWLRARYILPEGEIEWNLPVTLPAGQDSLVVELNESNGRRTPP